jgi:hypothetical protein
LHAGTCCVCGATFQDNSSVKPLIGPLVLDASLASSTSITYLCARHRVHNSILLQCREASPADGCTAATNARVAALLSSLYSPAQSPRSQLDDDMLFANPSPAHALAGSASGVQAVSSLSMNDDNEFGADDDESDGGQDEDENGEIGININGKNAASDGDALFAEAPAESATMLSALACSHESSLSALPSACEPSSLRRDVDMFESISTLPLACSSSSVLGALVPGGDGVSASTSTVSVQLLLQQQLLQQLHAPVQQAASLAAPPGYRTQSGSLEIPISSATPTKPCQGFFISESDRAKFESTKDMHRDGIQSADVIGSLCDQRFVTTPKRILTSSLFNLLLCFTGSYVEEGNELTIVYRARSANCDQVCGTAVNALRCKKCKEFLDIVRKRSSCERVYPSDPNVHHSHRKLMVQLVQTKAELQDLVDERSAAPESRKLVERLYNGLNGPNGAAFERTVAFDLITVLTELLPNGAFLSALVLQTVFAHWHSLIFSLFFFRCHST